MIAVARTILGPAQRRIAVARTSAAGAPPGRDCGGPAVGGRQPPEHRRAAATMQSMVLRDLALLIGSFVVASAIAAAAGATNLGTALTFGTIAFAAALMFVLLRH